MPTPPSRLVAILILLTAGAIPNSRGDEQAKPIPPAETVRRRETTLHGEDPARERLYLALDQLAARLAANGDPAAAREVLSHKLPLRSDRTLIHLPFRRSAHSLDNSPVVPTWQNECDEMCAAHAREIWQRTRSKLEAGDWTDTLGGALETLFYDPQHPDASRFAKPLLKAFPSTRSANSAGAPDAELPVAKRGGLRHPELGWPAGSYWRINTPHFEWLIQDHVQEARRWAPRLEILLLAWRQLFPQSWSTREQVERAVRGGGLSARTPRHQLVFFRDQTAYRQALRDHEPQVDITLGMYRAADQRSYFFGNPDASADTILHEVTHQLFQESPGSRLSAGEERHFWIVEALAMYMESLRIHERYATVGGWDATRLQHARFRGLRAQTHLPLRQLDHFGRRGLQEHSEIRGLYSQSVGLAHFLMHHEGNEFRPATQAFVHAIYTRNPADPSLEQMIGKGRNCEALDEAYLTEFLPIDDTTLHRLTGDEAPKRLCLAECDIHDAGLANLERIQVSELEWVDLTGCQVGDAGLRWLKDARNLRQLTLEGTSASDISMSFCAMASDLTELDLTRTRITDAGLEEVARLTRLETLWLTGTSVTNAGLESLSGLRALRELDVTGTRVNSAGIAALREKIPSLNKVSGP